MAHSMCEGTEGQGFSLKQKVCSPLDALRRQRDGLGEGHHIVLYITEALTPTPWECGKPHLEG